MRKSGREENGPPQQVVSSVPHDVQSVSPPQRILVVNDTPEILELMREILTGEGYDVVVYSYAIRDFQEIHEAQPDLIILDHIMGGEDYGWQFLQKIKLDRTLAAIPVIVCTAAVNVVRELEGHLYAKGVSVVLKPFDIDDLLREVSAATKLAQVAQSSAPKRSRAEASVNDVEVAPDEIVIESFPGGGKRSSGVGSPEPLRLTRTP